LSGQSLTYDANGNLLSDGQRNYAWDAANRLVSITYPGQPGKQTAFVYDGLNRRTAITSTPPGGGSSVTTSYIWCGTRPCQTRDAGNSTTREYYSEGEFVPGTPAQNYYYGVDQIGSVRRAFNSPGTSPAYNYDPYGNALQATALLTDFGYAGMFYNADSGLYLTQYRAYDPVAGRWLSRDPIGATNDDAINLALYVYVRDDPIIYVDPTGLKGLKPPPPTPDFDDCDVQLANDLARCDQMAKCSKRMGAICAAQARVRYAACLEGRRGPDLPPPYYPFSNNPLSNRDLILIGAGVVVAAGIIIAPEITLPLLLIPAASVP
jgi:RHS repeat-associated protein